MQAAQDELAASDILERALKVGDAAPDFSLPNAAGEQVSLAKLLENGPVAVMWYRGNWCPYCNIALQGYADAGKQIAAAGGTLVAISPELPDASLDTQQKHELEYQVLSDVGNAVAKKYEIVFELPPELAALYNENFALNEHNGDDSNTLPLAATYVIGKDGKIAWAFLDVDYKKRAEPSEVVAEIRKLTGAEADGGE
ncbi:AhpC/TSA family protein [Pseudenhygromyxa sp. WMMC2535]|nr:AhpC/TSA family protein [Pseudenhygromyxa sp. WMMC2535]